MDNILLNKIKQTTDNYTFTENGAITHKTTNSDLLDMFAMGAAMRNRPVEDILLMFKKAYKENAELAMKMLFYIRDVRGGQGERRFFRECIKWAAFNCTQSVRKNIKFIPEFGRWDDLYALIGTPLERDSLEFIKHQLALDTQCKTPSLLAKWLKSENASNKETIRLGNITREYLNLNHKQYRKILSVLRERIKIVERLMSENRWEEIEFDKIPSKAGLIYKNAFARHDIIKEKYKNFAQDVTTKVNAQALYPYEVVAKAINWIRASLISGNLNDTDRLMINKYWEGLTDYFNKSSLNAICMVDTSGSMLGRPMEVAVSLGLYCAEHNKGPWANHYISFASKPQLIETDGIDFVDKVKRIVKTNLCDNTNIVAAFDLILNTAIRENLNQKDMPEYIIIISDMEFDAATNYSSYDYSHRMTTRNVETVMETIEREFVQHGYYIPKIIYWNVDARHQNIPASMDGYISYVSGFSPSIFTSILTGKTGWDLMIEAITNDRYECIHA